MPGKNAISVIGDFNNGFNPQLPNEQNTDGKTVLVKDQGLTPGKQNMLISILSMEH
jgi:hypothetical protein